MSVTETAQRYHDISCGHRVVGHEGSCKHLHGHNYRIYFTLNAKSLDSVGRVIDFGVIKSVLCVWLDEKWDHRFLLWKNDPLLLELKKLDDSVVVLPFNPTAENLAKYLLEVVGPKQLEWTDAKLIQVRVEETRKCSATASL